MGSINGSSSELITLPPDLQNLFQRYSRITGEQATAHVNRLRREISPLLTPRSPIGQSKFLDLSLNKHPQYPTIIKRLRLGQIYLEINCSFAQDIRQILLDSSAPPSNLIGLDQDENRLRAGYAFFGDTPTGLGARLLASDVSRLNPEFEKFLNGRIDVLHDSGYVGLQTWQAQVHVCCVYARFTRAGALIVGRLDGSLVPGEYPLSGTAGATTTANGGPVAATGWRHNMESLRRLWDEVGKRTRTSWVVNGSLDCEGMAVPSARGDGRRKDLPGWWEANARRLVYYVQRV